MIFFPDNVFSEIQKVNELKTKWYEHQLMALRETSLYILRDTEDVHVYRFLWLRTFHHPLAVRILVTQDGGTIISKICSGKGGYKPGWLFKNRSRTMSVDEKNNFMSMVESNSFWELDSTEHDVKGCDGANWIIEGVKNRNYHIVDRWSPKSGPIKDLGLLFLSLGKIKTKKIY
jgi:hypothetical protein